MSVYRYTELTRLNITTFFLLLCCIPFVAASHDFSGILRAESHRALVRGWTSHYHSFLKTRDFEWEPLLPQCTTACSILEQAFTTCHTSACICTDNVAAGYSYCMICSINLSQNPSLVSDAQQSMNDFEVNCDSEGFPLSPVVVGTGGTVSPFTAPTAPAGTPLPSRTVTNYASGSVGTLSGSVIVISGGGSFGTAVDFSFSTQPSGASGQQAPTSSPSTTQSFPGPIVFGSSPATIQSSGTTVTFAAASSTNITLNPSSTSLPNSGIRYGSTSQLAKSGLLFLFMITLVL